MTLRSAIMNIVQRDGVNFHLTNSIPRRLATRWMGWFSKIENPWVCAASLRVWGLFTDLDLADARQAHFRSVHDCFTRRLVDGARPVDPEPTTLVSPCDGIVGACGRVDGTTVFQVKGMPYTLADLFADPTEGEMFRDGLFVTLRLTSAMYHRFHAPHDGQVTSVTHLFGDVWNVNPVTLKRVPRLFCKNERALIRMTLSGTGHHVTLAAVAAVLVAGIRLTFLDLSREDRTRPRHDYSCDATLRKGDEVGWYEHGSTILVFAPEGFALADGVQDGVRLRAGQPLMRLPGCHAWRDDAGPS